jgi:hypothetical protein
VRTLPPAELGAAASSPQPPSMLAVAAADEAASAQGDSLQLRDSVAGLSGTSAANEMLVARDDESREGVVAAAGRDVSRGE